MQVVEHVLNMRGGYVLDFSTYGFDQFLAEEIQVDATAPRYSADGVSKAKRLRRILPTLTPKQQGKLLRAFLEYRDSPVRKSRVELLDAEWRDAYEAIIRHLDGIRVPEVETAVAASAWTGRRSLREQIVLVRELVPVAATEIEILANLVEARRFNDPITADAVACLRDLHAQLGELLNAVDRGSLTKEAVVALEANRQKLARLVREGAKVTLVAPAMTFGVMHVLAWISGVSIDSTLVAGVFGSILGADALRTLGKKSTLDAE